MFDSISDIDVMRLIFRPPIYHLTDFVPVLFSFVFILLPLLTEEFILFDEYFSYALEHPGHKAFWIELN